MTRGTRPDLPVLIVDDEAHALHGFEMALRSGGFDHIRACSSGAEALAALESGGAEVMLLDLWMPGMSGEEVLARVSHEHPGLPVVIVTGVNEVDTAVRCIRAGAFDYLVKPVDRDRLVTTVARAVEVRELRRENSRLSRGLLSDDLERPEAFAEIACRSASMRSICRYCAAIASSTQPVLVTGETGVGKELIARALHALAGRAGSFVPVNVAGLDDNVFADTLFGHRKGAFTGADEARGGVIERAAGGTLFLDEVGDLSAASQLKLLRLVQEREYHPLGADLPRRTDARLIVATNRDPDELRRADRFRRDLFYRLCTHHIHVPPLRDRPDDLPDLVDRFLDEAAGTLGKRRPTAPKELIPLLRAHPFPGNVRELRALVMDAVAVHRSGVLSLDAFRRAVAAAARSPSAPEAVDRDAPAPAGTIRQVTQRLIDDAVRRAEGNQALAARMLGVSRQALNRRLRRKPS